MCLQVFITENYSLFWKWGPLLQRSVFAFAHSLQAPKNMRPGHPPWRASFFREDQNLGNKVYWQINRKLDSFCSCAWTFNLTKYFPLCSFERIILCMTICKAKISVIEHPCRQGIFTALSSAFTIGHYHHCFSDEKTKVPNALPQVT